MSVSQLSCLFGLFCSRVDALRQIFVRRDFNDHGAIAKGSVMEDEQVLVRGVRKVQGDQRPLEIQDVAPTVLTTLGVKSDHCTAIGRPALIAFGWTITRPGEHYSVTCSDTRDGVNSKNQRKYS